MYRPIQFARRLKQLRKQRGISQRALGELCGLTKHTIYQYEQGLRQPSLTALVALADYLEISLDSLVGRKF